MKSFIKAILGIDKKPNVHFTQLPSNEIEISMGNPNRPPFVKLSGKVIEGIVDVQYNYTTKSNESWGQHNFIIKYYCEGTNAIRTLSISRVWEDERK